MRYKDFKKFIDGWEGRSQPNRYIDGNSDVEVVLETPDPENEHYVRFKLFDVDELYVSHGHSLVIRCKPKEAVQ